MSLTIKYLKQEDKAVLYLNASQEESRVFLASRLNYLHLLFLLSQNVNSKASDIHVKSPHYPTSNSTRSNVRFDLGPEADVIKKVQVKKTDLGVFVKLIGGKGGSAIAIPESRLTSAYSSLLSFADNIGWDPEAALVRMAARSSTKELIKKTKRNISL